MQGFPLIVADGGARVEARRAFRAVNVPGARVTKGTARDGLHARDRIARMCGRTPGGAPPPPRARACAWVPPGDGTSWVCVVFGFWGVVFGG